MKKKIFVVMFIGLLLMACSSMEYLASKISESTSDTVTVETSPIASPTFEFTSVPPTPTQTLTPTPVPITRELPEGASKLITRGPIYSMAVSPDKKMIALGAAGGIYLLDGMDYHEIEFIPAENFVQLVVSLTFTADSNRLVASVYTDNVNNYLLTYDLDKSEMIQRIEGVPNQVGINSGMKVTASQADANLIVVSFSKKVYSWRLEANEWKPLFSGGDYIRDIVSSPDGTVYLATGERVISIDPLTGKIVNRFEGVFDSRTIGVAVSHDGRLVAATQKGRLVAWRVESSAIIIDESYEGVNDQLIYDILARPVFSENDKFLYYGETDELFRWNLETGEKEIGLTFGKADSHQHFFTHATLLAGKRVLAVDKLGEINVWSLDKQEIIYTSNKFTPGDTYWAAISPDKKQVAVAQSGGFGSNGLRIYDTATGKLLYWIETESFRQNIKYSPLGTYLDANIIYNAKTYDRVCGGRFNFYAPDESMFAFSGKQDGNSILNIVSLPDCEVIQSFEEDLVNVSKNFD